MNREHTTRFSKPAATRPAYKATPFVVAFVFFFLLGTKAAASQVTITAQPQNVTVVAGQKATFTAKASAVCRSVWFKNGFQLGYGQVAQTVSYTTPVTTIAMSEAKYTVEFYGCSGATGKVISQPALLTVTQSQTQGAPSITMQPSSRTVAPGQSATFATAATGSTPLHYQWQKNGAAISGATSTSYTTPATTTADSGSTFRVVVTDSAGSVTSNSATLTVNTASVAPSITTQPVNLTVTAGQTATFTVVAIGTAPLSYQWFKNGATISGATSSRYTTPARCSA